MDFFYELQEFLNYLSEHPWQFAMLLIALSALGTALHGDK